MQLVSDRRTWRIERRLHRLTLEDDGGGLPLSKFGFRNGVSHRGLAYGMAFWALLFFAVRVPLFGGLVALIPWPGRWVFIPALLAWLVTTQRLDGLTPHAWAIAAVRYAADVARDYVDHRPVRMLGHLRVAWTDDER